ncbi:hypothetical protein PG994_014087 [Apiospora phragmitis]|uniref:Zn(2)-C6 fungal-type domain-containing protein n=1 Tax=Apiospora phragmitis TaxID=2905665 RepID=A0ABR1T3A5_9PEZI
MTSNTGDSPTVRDSEDPTTPLGELEPPQSKRRKIRKGTQSCWECKRRKVRCTFVASADSTCDGCRSRRTNCVSQEFDDNGGTAHAVAQSARQSTAIRNSDQHCISASGKYENICSINLHRRLES